MFRKINDKMDHFTLQLEIVMQNQMCILEFKITISEIKNPIDQFNCSLDTAEKRISQLEDSRKHSAKVIYI